MNDDFKETIAHEGQAARQQERERMAPPMQQEQAAASRKDDESRYTIAAKGGDISASFGKPWRPKRIGHMSRRPKHKYEGRIDPILSRIHEMKVAG